MLRTYQCEICDEDRFGSDAQFQRHLELNHYRSKCRYCGCRFDTNFDLSDHYENCTEFRCYVCCRSFGSDESLIQHRSAKDHGSKYDSDADDVIRCPCGKEFDDDEDRDDHINNKEEEYNFIPCLTCAKVFKRIDSLIQHKEDTYHYKGAYDAWNIWQELFAYFDAYFKEKVMVSRGDRKKSRIEVQRVISTIMKNVRQQDGGQLYRGRLQPAGSTSTQTKIGKADEFDFNMPLAVNLASAETHGTVLYRFEVGPRTKLDSHENVVFNGDGVCIPNGFCRISGSHFNEECVNELLYDDYYEGTQDLIPRWIQEDLYKKIAHAIRVLNITNSKDVLDVLFCSVRLL